MKREMIGRGLAKGESSRDESNQQAIRPDNPTREEKPMIPKTPDMDAVLESTAKLFSDELERKKKKFAGQIHTETDNRSFVPI